MPTRVLLLDDDLAFAAEARRAFAAEGYEVDVLRDGVAAVARATEQRPDVVVVSAELPGINGFRLCSRLKREHEGLPVVLTFTDASASSVASHQNLPSHADAYVPRTVAIHELLTRVRAFTPRPRSETPASSRRRGSAAPAPARPRSKTPQRTSRPPPARPTARPTPAAGTAQLAPPAGAALTAPTPATTPATPATRTSSPGLVPPPSRPGSAGAAPRPSQPGVSPERDLLKRAAEVATAERDELRAALEAARVDADGLRRAADALRAERDARVRELGHATRELDALTEALEATRAERDEKGRELEASRSRIARLELQIVEIEREMYGATSERVDQRLVVMQRAAEASRLERDELRDALDDARRALEAERARRDDPAAVEQRVATAVDAMRREHALEMTRLRGEHAGIAFQLRQELTALRNAGVRPPADSLPLVVRKADEEAAAAAAVATEARKEAERALAEARREHEETTATMRDRHAREVGAMRANLEVAIRRIESLERQVGDARDRPSGETGERPSGESGERPSLAAARPGTRKRDEAGR